MLPFSLTGSKRACFTLPVTPGAAQAVAGVALASVPGCAGVPWQVRVYLCW